MDQESKHLVKSGADRQAALRQKKAAAGLTEVRGVYAKPADHKKIKAFAKSLQVTAPDT